MSYNVLHLCLIMCYIQNQGFIDIQAINPLFIPSLSLLPSFFIIMWHIFLLNKFNICPFLDDLIGWKYEEM